MSNCTTKLKDLLRGFYDPNVAVRPITLNVIPFISYIQSYKLRFYKTLKHYSIESTDTIEIK